MGNNGVEFFLRFVTLPLVIFLSGFSTVVLFYYLRKETAHLKHIVYMALSYLIFVGLCIGAIEFRIFYDGVSRLISVGLFAFGAILGNIGLYKMWRYAHQKN